MSRFSAAENSPKRRRPSSQKRRWRLYNESQTKEKEHFLLLLGELCSAADLEWGGGATRIALRDLLFCALLKVYSTFSSRRVMPDLHEAHSRGLIGKVPHFNSLSAFFREDALTPLLERLVMLSSLPLAGVETDFAVDATGVGTRRYRQWFNRHKGRLQRKRDWIGLHIICGVRTNVVTSARATEGREDENQFFEDLVRDTALQFKVSEVSADAGYLDARNMRQVLLLRAMPYIALRSNSTPHGEFKSSVWKALLHLYQHKRPEFAAHYYKRNNVESTFSMIKAKFGDRVRGKTLRAQINEALCKVICHNLCALVRSTYELDVKLESFSSAAPRPSASEERIMGCALSPEERAAVGERIRAAHAAASRPAGRASKRRGAGRRGDQPELPLFPPPAGG